MNWGYTSEIKESTGYEDIMQMIDIISPEEFNNLNESEQGVIVDKIFNAIRSKNIFPIYYYNDVGILDEINKCISKDVKIESNFINFTYTQGQHLCRFLFPSLHKVNVNGKNNMSMYQRFYNDNSLKKTIKFALKYERIRNTYNGIYRCSRLIEHGCASNFSPMLAKAIYEKYCPVNGIIYDYSCGFGGRMLGALSSKNNYRYFGVEPNTETFKSLNILGSYIETATNRSNIFKIYCKGSEDFRIEQEYVDFAFSSPPYFSLEHYSDEATQCYIKFNTVETWINGYVKPTIKNIYDMLKTESYYAVNIADFKYGKTEVRYVDDWIKLSKECGFAFVEELTMKVRRKRGDGTKENGKYKLKTEGIFVFKKLKIM